MKYRRFTARLLSPIVPVLLCAAPLTAQAVPVNIVTDESWSVVDSSMMPVGQAQQVCLNPTNPATCPATATDLGYPGAGWAADLSAIPGATWIWAPNVTGASGSAENATFVFEKMFWLCGAPVDGWIQVAADDSATVELNGHPITTSVGHNLIQHAVVNASSMANGPNILRVTVSNGQNPWTCGSGQYSCNPAGFVLGAHFQDALPALPQCAPGVEAGTSQPRACPAGLEGMASQLCGCISSQAVWWTVDTSGCYPPPTCQGNDRVYQVGEVEQLVCPSTPPIGNTSHQCQRDGWNQPLGTCSAPPPPPPPTCLGNDGVTRYAVDEIETLSCTLPEVGAPTRTCLPDGQFGPTSGSCTVPTVGPNEWCGARDLVPSVRANCPAGTECGPRLSRVCSGWWIFQSCTYIQTTDFYCL